MLYWIKEILIDLTKWSFFKNKERLSKLNSGFFCFRCFSYRQRRVVRSEDSTMLCLVRLCVRPAVGSQVERGETCSSARDGGLCDYSARRGHRRHLSRGCQHGEQWHWEFSRAPTIQTLVIWIASRNKYLSTIFFNQTSYSLITSYKVLYSTVVYFVSVIWLPHCALSTANVILNE